MAKGKFESLNWGDVNNWVMYGGSFLGTQKQTPEKLLPQCALNLEKYNIHGGFEAYHSAQVARQYLDEIHAITHRY